MSNNIVSQQFPIPSVQTGNLDPILNNTPGKHLQMELMESLSSDPMTQQCAISTAQMGISRSMPSKPGSQGLSMLSMPNGQYELFQNNMLPHHFPVQQSRQMETMLNNAGSPQFSAGLKRKEPMEVFSNSPVSPMFSMPNKRVVQVDHRPWLQQGPNRSSVQGQPSPNAQGPQQVPSSNKRKVQTEYSSGKSGASKSVNPKNQNARVQQSAKVQTESFVSVRSKMRESLAAALVLVSQNDKSSTGGKALESEDTGTLQKTEESPQLAGSTSNSVNAAKGVKQDISGDVGSTSAVTNPVDHLTAVEKEVSSSGDDCSAKMCKDNDSSKFSVEHNTNDNNARISTCGKEIFQSNYMLSTDDVPFSENFFVKDELLQGNGLSWVMDSDMVMGTQKGNQVEEQKSGPESAGGDCGRNPMNAPEILASKIEEELFKLFGGVNKKYKEKGRSLLFNIKDRNNPELRERVVSGEIPPGRLCSMTAEELASKELSQWRIAKAEEFAQMVVLPDEGVDPRRLVKKTHKGEFQVEVEHDDAVSVEVSGGASSGSQVRPKEKEKEVRYSSKVVGAKKEVNMSGGKSTSDQDGQCALTFPSNDGTDLMQGLMVDDTLKESDFLPPIVSLDEFMQSLDSEPPFENLPVESGKDTPESDKDDKKRESVSRSLNVTPSDAVDNDPDKPGKKDTAPAMLDADKKSSDSEANVASGIILSDARSGDGDSDKNGSIDTSYVKETANHVNVNSSNSNTGINKSSQTNADVRSIEESKSIGDLVWEGLLQLNISAASSVIGLFKSGDKTSAKEWPALLEIKGRVRLDAFEKFLQELPMSRSRSVMVVHFVPRGGSPDTEHSSLREVADSYIIDERVGFAEPASGVELYICPAHSKTVEMLGKIVPKEHVVALNAIDNGLIGVIVWRKPYLTSTNSPTSSSHHKHSSKKQHISSRRHQNTVSNTKVTPKPAAPPRGVVFPNAGMEADDDDIPPGFGPGAADMSRDDDDLPEFSFSAGGSNPSVPKFAHNPSTGPRIGPMTPSRPVDQMRELVYKYGQNESSMLSGKLQDKRGIGVRVQPWNDDDDDIPEWQPQPHQSSLPTQPMQQPRPHIVNPSYLISHQPVMPIQSIQSPTQGHQTIGSWRATGSHGNVNGTLSQQDGGQFYGTSAQGANWHQNVPRSRGF